MRRWLAAVAATLGLLALGPALTGSAGAVTAHSQLLSSEPGTGDVIVGPPPTQVRLVFSEPLEASYSSVNLKDAGDVQLAKNIGSPDPDDAYSLVVPLEPLPDGGYLIEWRALSAADGHTTQGFLSFGINDVPLEHGSEPGNVHSVSGVDGHGGYFDVAAPLEIAGRATAYLGILLGFGLLPVGWFVVRPAYGRLPRRLLQGQAAAVALGALGALLLGIQVAIRTELDLVTFLTTSRTGTIIFQRFVVGLVGVGAVVGLFALGRSRSALVAGGAFSWVALVLLALGGHAAAFTNPGPMVAMLVHLSSASVWLAGLLVLGLITRRADCPPLLVVVPRFSALALLSIALLAATGLYADWVQTRDVFSLAVGYQFYLALKIAVVTAALAVGGLNFLDGGRERPWCGGLRVRLGAEGILAVLVLLVTANLGSGFPPASERAITLAQAPTSAFLPAGAEIRLDIGPGRPGPNRFTVIVDPAPDPVNDLVSVEVDRLDQSAGPSKLYLDRLFEDLSQRTYYTDGGLLAPDSRWSAIVSVASRAGLQKGYARYAFALDDRGLIAGRELPPIDPGFLLGLLLLCGGVLGGVFALAGGALPRVHIRTGRLALAGGSLIGTIVGIVLVVYAGPL